MSEEEILKFLKTDIAFNEQNGNIKSDIWVSFEKEILNLIDKLQKENEQLKEENFDQVYMKAIADYKEKIRNKIKELQNAPLVYGLTIEVLEELLGDE